MSFLREYRLVVLGGRGVGRSALTVQFIENHFADEDYYLSDGCRKMCVVDDEVALLHVLDTSEQEEYRALWEQYIRTSEGFLIVYSITSRQSFEEISTFYQRVLNLKVKNSFPIMIVASKCDLEHERVVGINEGRDLAKHLGCKFIETSAKYRVNVDETFSNLVREIRKYSKKQQTGYPAPAGNDDGKGQHAPGCGTGCAVL